MVSSTTKYPEVNPLVMDLSSDESNLESPARTSLGALITVRDYHCLLKRVNEMEAELASQGTLRKPSETEAHLSSRVSLSDI